MLGVSGSGSDRRFAMKRLANNCDHDPIDVIMGDWLSEANMTTSAGRMFGMFDDASLAQAPLTGIPGLEIHRALRKSATNDLSWHPFAQLLLTSRSTRSKLW